MMMMVTMMNTHQKAAQVPEGSVSDKNLQFSCVSVLSVYVWSKCLQICCWTELIGWADNQQSSGFTFVCYTNTNKCLIHFWFWTFLGSSGAFLYEFMSVCWRPVQNQKIQIKRQWTDVSSRVKETCSYSKRFIQWQLDFLVLEDASPSIPKVSSKFIYP